MKLRVTIVDQQRAGRVGRAAIRLAVPRLLAQAAPRHARHWSSVTVVLLDDEGIRAMNRRVFALDKVTDVITQALRPHPGAPDGWAGDLYLNVERALSEGAVRPGGPARELTLYLAHGCDHLQGGRDDTPRRRAAMLSRESRWIEAGPLVPLQAVRRAKE